MRSATDASPRDSILDAALRLLAQSGYRKATMDDLAAESGVPRRSMYLHFASKEEVFLSSIDRVVDGVLAELRAIASERTSAETRLWRMLVARVMTRLDAVRNYRESLDEMLADLRTSYLARRDRYFAAETQLLAAVVADGVRSEGWQIDDPAQVAHALVQATNSLLPFSLQCAELGSRADVQARATVLAGLLLRGVCAPAVRPPPARPRR